ncbi:hypothetical protein [Halorubrum halodurans]|nr:hypothetical protein [Halorubrum halodurans]
MNKQSEHGFNWPYYLYTPDAYPDNRAATGRTDVMLVEPISSPDPTDDLDTHRDLAENIIKHSISRQLADRITAPFLVPVFPRVTAETNTDRFIQQLNARSLQIDGKFERVDKQLLRMTEHAQTLLAAEFNTTTPTPPELLLNGFSSSGHFVNKFTVLHPTHVAGVTAGGVNGMVTLPTDSVPWYDDPVPYPIGTAAIRDLTGNPFNLEAFRTTPQYYYLGGDDDIDTLPDPSLWTDDEHGDRQAIARNVYGTGDPSHDRFPRCRDMYRKQDIPAVFGIYADTGHTPRPASTDVIAFHEDVVLSNTGIHSFAATLDARAL